MSDQASKIDRAPSRAELGHDPYTHEEVLERMKLIRDRALDEVVKAAKSKAKNKWKGSGGAYRMVRENQLDIERLEDRIAGKPTGGTLAITVNGIDIGELKFSPPANGNGDHGPAGS